MGVVDEFQPEVSLWLDPTLEQANRPERGIELRPAFVLMPTDKVRAAFGLVVEGCQILYAALPDDDSFLSKPAWTKSEQRKRLRDAVLSRLKRTRVDSE